VKLKSSKGEKSKVELISALAVTNRNVKVKVAKRSETAKAEINQVKISGGFIGATAVKLQKLKSKCKNQP